MRASLRVGFALAILAMMGRTDAQSEERTKVRAVEGTTHQKGADS